MRDEEEDAIHRVDTVPPPDGEDDAYSAPTKLAAMPAEIVEKLRQQAANEVASTKAAATGSAAAPAAPPVATGPDTRVLVLALAALCATTFAALIAGAH